MYTDFACVWSMCVLLSPPISSLSKGKEMCSSIMKLMSHGMHLCDLEPAKSWVSVFHSIMEEDCMMLGTDVCVCSMNWSHNMKLLKHHVYNNNFTWFIWGLKFFFSFIAVTSDWGLWGCDTIYSCDRIPLFWRTLLPPSLGPLKWWYPTTTLHGIIA